MIFPRNLVRAEQAGINIFSDSNIPRCNRTALVLDVRFNLADYRLGIFGCHDAVSVDFRRKYQRVNYSLNFLQNFSKIQYRETLEKLKVLTRLEEKILRFVGGYLREYGGRSPTLAEIGAGCGVNSVGTVHRYISQIEHKGYLEKARKGWRTLAAPSALPFCGVIAAGQPLEAIEQDESIDLMSLLVQPDCFLLRIKGDSMVCSGIIEDDLVVIQRADTARNGQIVVVLVDGSDASLKEIRNLQNGSVELIPHNENLKTMTYAADQIQIQGVLRSVIRTY